MKKTGSILIGLTLVVIACSKSNETAVTSDCSSGTKSFSADVNPIIQSTCATNSSCHGTGSFNGVGPLTTYTQIFNARSSIRASVANGTMPKNGSLSASQKNTIICWIDNGASNN